jgi:hypothetical protein
MNFIHHEVAKCITEERIRNHLRDTEIKRLLQQIGIAQGSRPSHRLLSVVTALGRMLVTLGRLLESYGISSADISSDVQNSSQALPTG